MNPKTVGTKNLVALGLSSVSAKRKAGTREMPIPTEHDEQVAFVNWFRATYRGVRIFAIPNGGKRNIVAASKLRDEGVSAGILDLFVPCWGLWLEMKRRKGGKLSAAQKDWIEYLESIGHTVFVCPGARAARERVTEWRRGK